ncbi:MAG TPA: site-specific integrase [Acidimicrobiia bacterium]|nr:site-specific integrase [Acidimicrobiia bacterium]
MGNIQRVNRSKPWRARYWGPDGRQHSKSFARKIDAERWLKVSEAESLTGRWVDPAAGAEPFGPYAEEWIAVKRSTVGETTATNTESLLRARVLPEFGAKKLKQITIADVRKWMAAMTDEGLAPSTVYTYRRVLSQILDQAVDDGLILSNPAKKAKPPSVRPRRQLFLGARELQSLANECGDYGPLVWFLGWSGLRFGEATALRVGRVDPSRRRVRVEEAATEVGGRLVFGAPKTHKARTVIVPRFVIDTIQPLLEGRDADALVFTATRGGPVRLNNFRRRVFAPAAERIGKPELVPHDLRDTAASLAISSGASIKAVQRMLGHASAKMTLDVYGSLFEEDLEVLADRIEERYDNL